MSTPTAIKYEMTKGAGSWLRPVPEAAWDVDPADSGYLGAFFRMRTPTTRAAIWMCRRGNREWGLLLVCSASFVYANAASFFSAQPDNSVTWFLTVLAGWNAAKLGLVAVVLLLMRVSGLARASLRLRPQRRR